MDRNQVLSLGEQMVDPVVRPKRGDPVAPEAVARLVRGCLVQCSLLQNSIQPPPRAALHRSTLG